MYEKYKFINQIPTCCYKSSDAFGKAEELDQFYTFILNDVYTP